MLVCMNIYRFFKIIIPLIFSIAISILHFVLEKNHLHLGAYPDWIPHSSIIIHHTLMWLLAFFVINYGWIPTFTLGIALLCKWRWPAMILLCLLNWGAAGIVINYWSSNAATLINIATTLLTLTFFMFCTLYDLFLCVFGVLIICITLYLPLSCIPVFKKNLRINT
jgi:hypothetical protein